MAGILIFHRIIHFIIHLIIGGTLLMDMEACGGILLGSIQGITEWVIRGIIPILYRIGEVVM